MSTFNWCHGPSCHKRETTTRVRGVKGHKVLRTVKIALNSNSNWIRDTQWEYFCDQTCMHDFIKKHIQEFVRIHPRTAPLETPVEVIKEVRQGYNGNYTQTAINIVDNG